MKVIEMRKGFEHSPGTACPYCHSINVSSQLRPIEKNVQQADYLGYPILQERYREVHDYFCNDCSRKYIVDFGENIYSIYKYPFSQNNIGDIECLARFESQWNYNFEIYIAMSPTKRPRYYYFIKYETDAYPMFITRKQLLAFLKDSEKASSYLHSCWMTRYR